MARFPEEPVIHHLARGGMVGQDVHCTYSNEDLTACCQSCEEDTHTASSHSERLVKRRDFIQVRETNRKHF